MRTCRVCAIEKALECFPRPRGARVDNRCKECAAAYMREYYIRNREKYQEQARRWAREHPGSSTERVRRWYKANPERKRSIARKWRLANPEYPAKWRAENPELAREQARLDGQRRRARLAAIEVNDFTKEEWAAVLAAASGRCAYCGKRRKLTMDHVVPISLGGHHTASNIVAVCKPCNSSKGTGPVVPYQLGLTA